MMKRHCPPRPVAAVAIALAGVLPAISAADSAVPADVAADMARCATVSSTAARLACYDALAGRAEPAPAKAPSGTSAAAGIVAPAATAAPAPAPAPVVPARDKAGFGLPAVPEPRAAADQQSITATIAQVHEDRQGQVTVDLDNGQTWQVREPGVSLDAGSSVTIARGALGSFVMTTPRKHTYHVHRIR